MSRMTCHVHKDILHILAQPGGARDHHQSHHGRGGQFFDVLCRYLSMLLRTVSIFFLFACSIHDLSSHGSSLNVAHGEASVRRRQAGQYMKRGEPIYILAMASNLIAMASNLLPG